MTRGVALTRTWPRAFVLLLLACLLVQATAVQTHIHYAHRGLLLAPASGHRPVQASNPAKGDPAGTCPLCQDRAIAGAYVLPPAIVLPPPPEPVLWIATATLLEFGLPSPAFGWLSRAPPQ